MMKKLLLTFGAAACMLAFAADSAEAQTARLGDAIRNAAEELSAGMPPDARVAVISMRADSMRMSDHLMDEMIMAFVNTRRLLVVNRAQLELIAAEQQLAIGGLIDDATAQAVGRLAGVQFIFTGAFEPFGDIYRLRIQAIEVETAIIRSIHIANVWNDPVVSTLLGAAGRAPPRRVAREAREPRRDPDQPRVNWFSFEVSYVTLNYACAIGLGLGFRYERDINDLFSVGGVFRYSFLADFEGLVTARFFPGGSPFYIEAGLGFGFGWNWVYGSNPYYGMMFSLGIGARLGGRARGFFFNPFLGIYPLAPSRGFRFRGGAGFGFAW